MRVPRRFLFALVLAAALAAGIPVRAAGPAEVSGKFLANGKPGSLRFVRIVPHDPFGGEEAWLIILCEKDPAKTETPEDDARFKKLGDALIIGVTKSGKDFSNTLIHRALEMSGLVTIGTVDVEDFRIESGVLSGRFVMKKEQELKPDRFSFDVRVRAPLPRGK